MTDEFKVGAEIEVGHPFIREEYHGFDEDGPFKRMSWRPGLRVEPVMPDSAEEVADGIGTQIITIVSIHKPGKYPTRIFFTRRWRDPQGREFGKTKLCMTTQGAFRTRCRGYRHEFRVAEDTAVPEQLTRIQTGDDDGKRSPQGSGKLGSPKAGGPIRWPPAADV